MSCEEFDKFHSGQSFFPLRNVSGYVQTELNNRKENFGNGFNDRVPYKGAYMGWCRAASMAQVIINNTRKNGFVMYSNLGFEKIYGYQLNEKTVLGFDLDGNEHTMKSINSFNRPSPGLIGMTTDFSAGDGKFRSMELKYKCNSKAQFEYISPYFMTPGITVVVEWGWNTFNKQSLINYNDVASLKDNWSDWEKRRCISNGNYDIFIGIISKFNFNLLDDGSFECTITLSSVSRTIYGYNLKTEEIESDDSSDSRQFLDTLKDDLNSIAENVGFSTVDKTISSGDLEYKLNKIRKPSYWVTFRQFVNQLNGKLYFKYVSQEAGGKEIPLKLDIEQSYISATPNLKSSDGKVLLIPNSKAPFFALENDNWNLLHSDLSGNIDENSSAVKALQESLKLTDGEISDEDDVEFKYDENSFKTNKRVNLANIIGHNLTNRVNNDLTSSVLFPDYKTYNGYAGHIGNLYINVDAIIKSFETSNTLKSAIEDLLKKVSRAAGNIWNFEIQDVSNGMYTIRDSSFVGIDETNNIKSLDTFFENNSPSQEVLKFSSITNKSNVLSVNFSAELADSVSTQTIVSSGVSINSNSSQEFYRVVTSGRQGEIVIEDKTSKIEKLPGNTNADEKPPKPRVLPQSSVEYYPVKIDDGENEIIIRLVEPNEEIVKSSRKEDNVAQNCTVHNSPIPGVKVSVETLGISGIRFMDVFTIDNLPYPYDKKVLLQVTNVKHSFDGNVWKTTIEAGVRPNPELFTKQNQLND